MPKKHKSERPTLAGRYSPARVNAEIKAVLARSERGTHKRLSLALGLATSQQLSHRLSEAYELPVEEIGVIADFFSAPIGWPFVPWEIGRALTVKK